MGIEVYADIGCPFAHVGLLSAKRLRDRLPHRAPLVVRAWPLELVNGTPLDPQATAAHVAELRRDVVPELFAGFDPANLPVSTLRAHALVEAANERDPWLGERLSLELRDRLFEQGSAIDEATLVELARESGLDPSVLDDTDRVEARYAEGRSRGVQGSPHFFAGQTELFCPLLDIERDDAGGIHIKERVERLERLLQGAV